jgi:hypothetical protein
MDWLWVSAAVAYPNLLGTKSLFFFIVDSIADGRCGNQ